MGLDLTHYQPINWSLGTCVVGNQPTATEAGLDRGEDKQNGDLDNVTPSLSTLHAIIALVA